MCSVNLPLVTLIATGNGHATSAISVHCEPNNHPQADTCHFRVIGKDTKQVVSESQGSHPCQDQQCSTQSQYWQNAHPGNVQQPSGST